MNSPRTKQMRKGIHYAINLERKQVALPETRKTKRAAHIVAGILSYDEISLALTEVFS